MVNVLRVNYRKTKIDIGFNILYERDCIHSAVGRWLRPFLNPCGAMRAFRKCCFKFCGKTPLNRNCRIEALMEAFNFNTVIDKGHAWSLATLPIFKTTSYPRHFAPPFILKGPQLATQRLAAQPKLATIIHFPQPTSPVLDCGCCLLFRNPP